METGAEVTLKPACVKARCARGMCRMSVIKMMASMPSAASMSRLNWAFCDVFALYRSSQRGVMLKYEASVRAVSSASDGWVPVAKPPVAKMGKPNC